MKLLGFLPGGRALVAVLPLLLVWAAAAQPRRPSGFRVDLPVVQTPDLLYAAAPVDNPLKGFVPYQNDSGRGRFPHSLANGNLPLRALMTGPKTFVWDRLEQQLNSAASEGCQYLPYVYLDFPTLTTGIPQFLLDGGLLTRPYADFGNTNSVAPDYEDPNLRAALTNYIAALGQRYDGDPRLGFIYVGLLGFWGEWHMGSGQMAKYFASTNVQTEVLDAYQAAFKKTKLLVRYPSKLNVDRPFGYADESFCWDTMSPPSWYMSGALQSAGPAAVNRWRTHPFGGELRPELWYCIWGEPSCAPSGQDFNRCVDAMHATWLLNSGVFAASLTNAPRARALAGARRLGYEFYAVSFSVQPEQSGLLLRVRIKNTGVAPFYYDWPLELAATNPYGQLLRKWPTPWVISGILPGDPGVMLAMPLADPPPSGSKLLLRVINPLPSGKPLRFANTSQDTTIPGWLTLGVMP